MFESDVSFRVLDEIVYLHSVSVRNIDDGMRFSYLWKAVVENNLHDIGPVEFLSRAELSIRILMQVAREQGQQPIAFFLLPIGCLELVILTGDEENLAQRTRNILLAAVEKQRAKLILNLLHLLFGTQASEIDSGGGCGCLSFCDDHVEVHELREHFVFHIGHVQTSVTVLSVLDNQAMVTAWT